MLAEAASCVIHNFASLRESINRLNVAWNSELSLGSQLQRPREEGHRKKTLQDACTTSTIYFIPHWNTSEKENAPGNFRSFPPPPTDTSIPFTDSGILAAAHILTQNSPLHPPFACRKWNEKREDDAPIHGKLLLIQYESWHYAAAGAADALGRDHVLIVVVFGVNIGDYIFVGTMLPPELRMLWGEITF
ncbi:hypothetical protein QE152_g27195 [Popillia japonica]|uniref:Uncharacterized protein n=1 Tax=Popillia japonica TaxID=7064 RepID=A0AAW1JW28_POPJA